jgi:hypothetical protein
MKTWQTNAPVGETPGVWLIVAENGLVSRGGVIAG